MAHYTLLLSTGDNTAAHQLLDRMAAVRRVKVREDGRLEVQLKKELTPAQIDAAKHELLTALSGAGIDLAEMTRRTLSMEDIFFRATESA